MLKVRHATLVVISGLVWLGVGCFLLPLGLKLLVSSTMPSSGTTSYPVVDSLAPFVGGVQEAALLLICLCMFVGYAKGKYVLGKSVKRSIDRITTFPNPTNLSNIYSRGYYMIFGFMVLLGMSIKWLGLPTDVRGMVDVAIGAALINGAMNYFRTAASMRQAA